ncbi:hypothetical protein [Acidicapsa ligni]|uniref:hypothetical protein n=1 Tax=Acidicapsa ligni TaxID=542300 RepID=UPI0021DFB349|nr:hypothetical protein [Acidicapsa ligni]
MNKLLRYFIPSVNEHLSDDRLANLLCGDLSFLQRWIAQRHLAACSQCKLQQEELEGPRAEHFFDHYLQIRRREKLSDEPEMQFAKKLRTHIQNVPQEHKAFLFPKISFPELSLMNPALVACVVFGFATVLSFFFWWQQRTPQISSNALLVRAEKWDTSSLASASGVVYQTVRITMTKESKQETLSRAIYRDPKGKRKPKPIRLDESQEQVKNTLTTAGLDWDEPLSASGYQNWHDHQHIREDHIARAGSHLLRLTTTVPEGFVSEQSLTVRDTDFHPVQRTVALRNSSTVEIAEVDFKILPWNQVNSNVFEPSEIASSGAVSNTARILPFPHLPETLTEEQIDVAELGARLMLNRLHADSGVPIELHRNAQGVTVDGLVDTENRRRELQAGLQSVPHVTVAIQSDEALKANPSAMNSVQSISVASMPDQPSPLEIYLESHGQKIADINSLAQQFFDDALTINQESREIADLQTRFTPEGQTLLTSATLSELIYRHHERLEEALRRERELLGDAQSAPTPDPGSPTPSTSSLVEAAERNLALAKELTQTNHPAVRTADRILAEMSLAMNDLIAGAREAYGKSQSHVSLSGKK